MNRNRSSVRRRLADLYSFEQSLATTCAVCGIGADAALAKTRYLLVKYLAPISARCPVATFVGVCRVCLRRDHTSGRVDGPPFLGDGCPCPWSPPSLIRPVDEEHVYVVRLGYADDARLAGIVGRVWGKLPVNVRASMRKFLCPRVETDVREVRQTLSKGALRVEALRNYPGSRRHLGVCLQDGHAIRILAPAVNGMPDLVLSTLVAHELAHVYQSAAWRERRQTALRDEEADARELMAAWGFEDAVIDAWVSRERDERLWAKIHRMQRKWADDERNDPDDEGR